MSPLLRSRIAGSYSRSYSKLNFIETKNQKKTKTKLSFEFMVCCSVCKDKHKETILSSRRKKSLESGKYISSSLVWKDIPMEISALFQLRSKGPNHCNGSPLSNILNQVAMK